MRTSKVMLDSIYISQTYGGCLEGMPSKDYVVNSAKEELAKMYGTNRPTHIIIPEGDLLPKYQYFGWFNSFSPKDDKNAYGSHLFLIWWDNEQTLNGVTDFAASCWAHAEDYYL